METTYILLLKLRRKVWTYLWVIWSRSGPCRKRRDTCNWACVISWFSLVISDRISFGEPITLSSTQARTCRLVNCFVDWRIFSTCSGLRIERRETAYVSKIRGKHISPGNRRWGPWIVFESKGSRIAYCEIISKVLYNWTRDQVAASYFRVYSYQGPDFTTNGPELPYSWLAFISLSSLLKPALIHEFSKVGRPSKSETDCMKEAGDPIWDCGWRL